MNAGTQFDTLPERAETQRGLVAVAMSGGVDSSAVAALLQQQGRAVVGLTMQLWNQRRLPELQGDGPAQHRCCSLDDVYDAKAVAQHLNFPHYVVNFEEQFEARVVRPFVDQYLAGRTPIAYTATGRWELLRARDETKDQSYFLWGLSQEQLSRSDFPLGELTKEEVRALARRVNLPVAEKPESMELCFVPTGNYVQFIQAYSQERGISLQNGEGEIVNENGDVIGRHNGVHGFTIGQRKGLGFAAGKPLYVLSIDPEKNRVVVGEDDVLRKTVCEVEGVNWISCEKPPAAIRAFAKIRHKHEPAPATIEPLAATTARVTFDTPQRAITPGQAAVFYDGDIVLGGAWIR
jgi:tRNA-specific 2-thiouridylase